MLDAWALRHKQLKKRVYGALVENRNLRRAACLRALTLSERDDFRRLGLRSPVAVIPNAVEIPDVDATQFLQRFPLLNGKRIVLYLGRLHHKKGPALLCQAWSRVRHQFGDAHLVIAGPDFENTQRDLEHLIGDLNLGSSVLLPGLLKGSLAASALKAATVFVLPSFSEGFSRALLEAMGAGVPVIATHACNFPEVAERNCGILIAPEQKALAAALQEMLAASPDQRQTLGHNGQQLVRERYSWPVVGGALAALYGWALGGGQPPPGLRVEFT
jgi:glycosyltransferase involved in cell wall biosynthesis